MERVWGTLQQRLPPLLRLEAITTVEAANRFLAETYLDEHNERFAVTPAEEGSAFVPSSAIWPACFAPSTSARSATTTACALAISIFKFPSNATAATTCGSPSRCVSTRTGACRFSTARAVLGRLHRRRRLDHRRNTKTNSRLSPLGG